MVTSIKLAKNYGGFSFQLYGWGRNKAEQMLETWAKSEEKILYKN